MQHKRRLALYKKNTLHLFYITIQYVERMCRVLFLLGQYSFVLYNFCALFHLHPYMQRFFVPKILLLQLINIHVYTYRLRARPIVSKLCVKVCIKMSSRKANMMHVLGDNSPLVDCMKHSPKKGIFSVVQDSFNVESVHMRLTVFEFMRDD